MGSVASPSVSREAGFSIVEVVVSMLLLMTVALGVAQLFAVGTQANWRAKNQTSTAILAAQKMEQLKALTWAFDTEGLPVSDVTTRLDLPMPTGGGTGLNPSPANSLTADTAGYVDYLDAHGTYLGTGPTPAAAYCRRWSVEPLPLNPNNTLIFQVRVIPMGQLADADAGGDRAREEALIFSVKTRKAP
jgi:type II secretory pathway pseudopilin PulG